MVSVCISVLFQWRLVIFQCVPIMQIYTLRPRQDVFHFPDDIFKCIFMNKDARMLINIILHFVPLVSINNISALVKIMAWHRPGDKPLSEPIMVRLPTHIFVIRPQWVNTVLLLGYHWMIPSASVVPVASQCTCGSSWPPVRSNYANSHWIATGRPLGDSISQWSSSVVYPFVPQCTESIWFGGH